MKKLDVKDDGVLSAGDAGASEIVRVRSNPAAFRGGVGNAVVMVGGRRVVVRSTGLDVSRGDYEVMREQRIGVHQAVVLT